MKNYPCDQQRARLLIAALGCVLAFVSGCSKKEIEKLKTECGALKSKVIGLEADRNNLIQASNALALAKEGLNKGILALQLELSKASNTFQLERNGLLLTNGFYASEVERLRSELKAQQNVLAEDQRRQKESKKLEPIRNALKALRKLQGATSVGLNQRDYSSLLIEQRGAIDDAVAASSGPLQGAIKAAAQAFQDANTLWQWSIHPEYRPTGEFGTYVSREYSPVVANIVEKYSIPKGNAKKGAEDFHIQRGEALSRIWNSASVSCKLAEDLFAKESDGQ